MLWPVVRELGQSDLLFKDYSTEKHKNRSGILNENNFQCYLHTASRHKENGFKYAIKENLLLKEMYWRF